MRKPTLSDKRGHGIRARRRTRSRSRLMRTPEERQSNRLSKRESVIIHTPSGCRNGISLNPSTPLPVKLCMLAEPQVTVQTLGLIRRRLFKQPIQYKVGPGHQARYIESYLDFSTLEEITTPAALILLAEFQRKLMVKGQRTQLVNLHQWQPSVVAKLRQIGFFSVLGFTDADILGEIIDDPDVKVMEFIRGRKGDELEGINKQLHALIDFIDPAVQIGGDVRKFLTSAIAEAITNVGMHAYVDGPEFQYPHVGSYWFAGAADVRNRRLSVSMYDQGHTIPKTYDQARWNQKAIAFLRNINKDERNDAVYIEAAVKYGSSRTGDEHRGHGLPQICDAIQNCPGGRVLIGSRSGLYETGVGIKPIGRVLDGSIGGTLISWEVNF